MLSLEILMQLQQIRGAGCGRFKDRGQAREPTEFNCGAHPVYHQRGLKWPNVRVVIIHMRNIEFEGNGVRLKKEAAGGAERDQQDGHEAAQGVRFQAGHVERSSDSGRLRPARGLPSVPHAR